MKEDVDKERERFYFYEEEGYLGEGRDGDEVYF